MSDERHARIKALFLEALESDVAARAALLERLGLEAPADRDELASLLAHAEDGGHDTGSAPAPGGRLRPGETFAGRYRIEAPLGRGGAGEVYRAEDLVVGGPVALKLLRVRTAGSAEAILNEVRLARQVTHPAVCRVHDVVPFGDELCITLELIEGEDLAARVRRSGGMPPNEVLDIARQLCGGLAAAHARGILHRDLKPANVLIDRQGRVRITDFGLAVAGSGAHGFSGGTPSYMAPEQFSADGHVSEQTDLYALGLLLHELLTGQAVFPTVRLWEEPRLRQLSRPPAPGTLVAGVDPALDRVIRAATHPDPQRRPASALAVAAALPGGDPLGLALAIGSTAPPEIVAAVESGPETLSWAQGFAALASLVALLVALLALGSGEWRRAAPHLGKGPAILSRQLGAHLAGLGIVVPEGAGDQGFMDDPTAGKLPRSILYWRRANLPAAGLHRIERLERSSPDAALDLPQPSGAVLAMTDPLGRLVHLEVDRPLAAPGSSAGANGAVDWRRAFRAAGLDPARFVAIPGPLPQVFAEQRTVWRGLGADGSRLRVEAAAAGGQPVLFTVSGGEDVQLARPADGSAGWRTAIVVLFLLGAPLGALSLGWINLRRKQADRRGARRVALAVALSMGFASVLSVGHAPSPAVPQVASSLVSILFSALSVWVCYIGFEPWARRFQPRLLIAWTRLLAGRVRDPLVGRSLLVGAIAGCTFVVIDQLDRLLCRRFGQVPIFPAVIAEQLTPLCTPRLLLAALTSRAPEAITIALPFALLLMIARRWLPVRWSTPAAFLLFSAVMWGLLANSPLLSLFVGVPLTAAVGLLTLERFGLLAIVTAAAIGFALSGAPLTLALDAWYGRSTLLTLAFTVAVGLVGMLWACSRRPGPAAVRFSSSLPSGG